MRYMRIFFALVLVFLSFDSAGFCVTINDAVSDINADIKQTTGELNRLRDSVSKERTSLNAEIEKAQNEVEKLRQEARHLSAVKFREGEEFSLLKDASEQSAEDVRFITSLLTEHFRELRKRMAAGEEFTYKQEISKLAEVLDHDDVEVIKYFDDFLFLADKRDNNAIGGYFSNGYALDQEGNLRAGRWLFFGPVSYFFSDDGSTAGLSGALTNHIRPAVLYDVSLEQGQKIFKGQTGWLPVDITLGGALKIEGMKRTWFQHIKAGGVIIIPILLLGVFCVVCAVWKLLVLRTLSIPDQNIINKLVILVHGARKEEAFKIIKSLGVPFGPVFREGVEHSGTEKEHLEEIMHERILFQIPYLEKGLSLLAVGAAASPLLGLLGTVTGMMHTFNLVAIFGTGKADLLSSGISEALITTEYGLIVAIPALLAHAFLSRRVKVIIHMLEQKSMAYVNALSWKGFIPSDVEGNSREVNE